MGKRADGYYPTDPYATEAARAWLARHMPAVLREPWLDPAAGYGALLEGLGIPPERRFAIELARRHRAELARRVPASNLVIGDGLALTWRAQNVAMNPDFDNDVMTAFVARALAHQERCAGGVVLCLALATWWHSDALRAKGSGLRRPRYVLVPAQRVSCDGTGRGDMRAIDWLVWTAQAGPTEVVWLPPASPRPELIAEHRRLSLLGAA